MNKADSLLLAYNNLSWDNYIEISEAFTVVNTGDLNKDLEKQSANYAYINGLASYAKKQLDEANLDVEQFIAITRKEEQERKLLAGEKATDKYLESFVLSSEKYCILNKALIDKNYKYNLLKNLVQAIETKKDCLIQLSANSRAELNLTAK